MKRYYQFFIVSFLLISVFAYLGCGTKETTSNREVVEVVADQTLQARETSFSVEAELKDRPRSPEAELRDRPRSPEAELRDRPRSPEAALRDKPRSPEAELRDRPRSPEAELRDKPRSPEAELKDRPRSPEAELKDKPRSPELVGGGVTIKGKVIDTSTEQKPIEDVTVKIVDVASRQEYILKTDKDGIYEKTGLPPGRYAVSVVKVGYGARVGKSKVVAAGGELNDIIKLAESEQNNENKRVEIDIPKNSVLHLIPDETLGLIYCGSLLELNQRINDLVAQLIPQLGQGPELLAQLLAETFGAGFERLEELEDIGLDLNNDFAIFLNSIDPPSLSAAIHLTDPDSMMEVILAEAEGSEPMQYNDETYWSTPDGSGVFAVLDNTLIFSQESEVIEQVIDVRSKHEVSIVNDPTYASFVSDVMKGTDQVSAFFNMQTVIAPLTNEIENELQSIIDTMESDPAVMVFQGYLEDIFDILLTMVNEFSAVGVALQIDGTDVQLTQSTQFYENGKVQEFLKRMSTDGLTLIDDLPNGAYMIGGSKLDPEIFIDLWTTLLEAIIKIDPDEESDEFAEVKVFLETIHQEMEDLGNVFTDEMSFATNYEESLIPNALYVLGVKDEQKLMTYMDERFLGQIQELVRLIKANIDEAAELRIFDDAQYENVIVHNDAEIKTIVFPNFGAEWIDVPAELGMMLPEQWRWSYAFSDGLMYFSLGGPEHIKTALDSKAKMVESIAENISFQNLKDKLGADNNLLYAISPLTMIKSNLTQISKTDPAGAAELQMIIGLLDGIPENYSIGLSAKAEGNIVNTKLHISVGDFSQVVQTIFMFSGMGQMQ